MENKVYHSVRLDREKCLGCTNCIKRCPTEAIRVQHGKAKIISERCIDCGECIRVCPHNAKKAVYEHMADFEGRFKYKIALPAPALYGQFNNLEDVDYVLTGLIKIGFDEVFEVSRAAEIISDYTRGVIRGESDIKVKLPIISSACPAVVRLIQVRFPSLIPNVLPILPPVELAAKIARERAVKKTGLAPEEIGVFFISPCPAKVTAAKQPLGSEKSNIDAVLSMTSVYKRLVPAMNKIVEPMPFSKSGIVGISWASSGGEATALLRDKYLAADGIENCKKLLSEIEDGKLPDLEFIELNACTSGCVGGALTFASPFIAKSRIQTLRKYLPVSRNSYQKSEIAPEDMEWSEDLVYNPVFRLSNDRQKAIEMKLKMDAITEGLPGLDCGSCGAPSCRALAEDITRGLAKESDCIFKLREKIAFMWDAVSAFDKYGPSLHGDAEAGHIEEAQK